MQNIKYKIIYFWLTHVFLRHIGKRYPEFFENWICDVTESARQRQVMMLRYTGKTQMKFEAIAITMNADLSNVFKYHKKVVDAIISG